MKKNKNIIIEEKKILIRINQKKYKTKIKNK